MHVQVPTRFATVVEHEFDVSLGKYVTFGSGITAVPRVLQVPGQPTRTDSDLNPGEGPSLLETVCFFHFVRRLSDASAQTSMELGPRKHEVCVEESELLPLTLSSR